MPLPHHLVRVSPQRLCMRLRHGRESVAWPTVTSTTVTSTTVTSTTVTSTTVTSTTKGFLMIAAICRLRKHADYQRVYSGSRKQFGKQMSYFFLPRSPLGADWRLLRGANPEGARVGLTVGKVLGNAVHRNRIKRRMREAVRRQLPLLKLPVDVVLHPRRSVVDLEFAHLEREVASVFRAIQRASERPSALSSPDTE
jgi:ribonuclease P protein component